jgi:3-oxoacyl-[acyl-carrier protein] reductase
MQIDLSGKTALVTGGNVGIGRAIAIALAEAGADVAVTYLTHSGTDTAQAIQALGRRGLAVQMDATDSGDVNRTVAESAERLGGRIDILVNNAGGLISRLSIAEMSDEHWRRVLDVNVTSAFYCVRAALPYMTAGWGRIVNNGSVAGHHGGGAGAVAYATAKGAIHTFTRGLAKELAPRGITVNAIAPGFIVETPFHATFTPEDAQTAIVAQTPLKRAGLPSDVAGAVLYLVSHLAAFITGEIVEVNGGAWFA